MDEIVIMDWSFIFVLAMVGVLVAGLTLRSRRIKRRQKREERRAAKRAFNEWMARGSRPMDLDGRNSPPPEH